YDDIVMNNCITSWNIAEINANADKAAEWGVNINFSAYTPRRTGCRDYFPDSIAQLKTLDLELDRLQERMNSSYWITNNKTTLDATRRYFKQGTMAGCKAGLRWLVVTSDGALQPCSMQFKRYGLHEQDRMVNEFTQKNACDECYVSIRSYLDKTFPQLVRENVTEFFSFKSQPNRNHSMANRPA
ncbi:MAG TPA: hypothetical protein VLL97_04225, partial [Acidobacteriota bacterium]|nr:hypothetical protein [Acidobacteriota bacterium]